MKDFGTQRLSANHEAIRLFTQGLNLVRSLPGSSEHIQQELEILIGLGEAQRKAGQFTESVESFQQAAEIALESGSPEDLARAALGYEESRWRFDLPSEPAVKLLEKALDLLEDGDSVLRVRVQVSLVRTLMATSSPEQFAAMSQQVLEEARRVNDPRALYDAIYLNIRGERRPEKSAERMKKIDEMLQLAEAVGNREGLGDAISFRLLEQLELGDIHAFRKELGSLTSILKKLQQPFYSYNLRIFQSMLALLDGRFEEAEREAQQALDFGRQMRVENVAGV